MRSIGVGRVIDYDVNAKGTTFVTIRPLDGAPAFGGFALPRARGYYPPAIIGKRIRFELFISCISYIELADVVDDPNDPPSAAETYRRLRGEASL